LIGFKPIKVRVSHAATLINSGNLQNADLETLSKSATIIPGAKQVYKPGE
jgi:hypothetical protein